MTKQYCYLDYLSLSRTNKNGFSGMTMQLFFGVMLQKLNNGFRLVQKKKESAVCVKLP